MSLTAQNLFQYANDFARSREARGEGTAYPTFRQAARRFRTTLDEVEQAIENYHGEGYLGQGVALGIPGRGSCAIASRGDYLVEAYP